MHVAMWRYAHPSAWERAFCRSIHSETPAINTPSYFATVLTAVVALVLGQAVQLDAAPVPKSEPIPKPKFDLEAFQDAMTKQIEYDADIDKLLRNATDLGAQLSKGFVDEDEAKAARNAGFLLSSLSTSSEVDLCVTIITARLKTARLKLVDYGLSDDDFKKVLKEAYRNDVYRRASLLSAKPLEFDRRVKQLRSDAKKAEVDLVKVGLTPEKLRVLHAFSLHAALEEEIGYLERAEAAEAFESILKGVRELAEQLRLPGLAKHGWPEARIAEVKARLQK